MQYLVLLTIGLFLFPTTTTKSYKNTRTYLTLPIEKPVKPHQSYYLYRSLTTGNKEKLSPSLKRKIKKYGALHLLTPSGIHLGSLFFVRFLPGIFQMILYVFMLGLLIPLGSYHSLERIIFFKMFGLKLKKVQNLSAVQQFCFSMFFCMCIGHYYRNPLSFIFSFIFWGTILIYHKNPLKLTFYLFVSLLFINSLTQELTTISSIIINPFLTFIMSLIFPFLILNLGLPDLLKVDQFLYDILNIFIRIIDALNKYDSSPQILLSTISILFLVLIIFTKDKVLLTLFLLMVTVEHPIKLSSYYPKVLYKAEASQSGLIKGEYIYFKHQKCKRDINFRFYCYKPQKKGPQ